MIRAVTFDFWDTLAIDDSDEPARAAAGLLPKPAAREAMFVDELLRHHPSLDRTAVAAAFAQANAWARSRWKDDHVNPSVAQRVAEGYRRLRLAPTPGFAALVGRLEQMEVEIPPQLLDGAAEALAQLASRYRVGVISDTIVTPGRGLRAILEQAGLLEHFTPSGLIFSDEIGCAKPQPAIFHAACAGLGVSPAEAVHVGDRESNDVVGPHGVGMKSVLFVGAVDRGSARTTADMVCSSLLALPDILANLCAGGPL